VFGRNIFQHERPAAMAAALKALIHDDASTDAAAAALS
jgi:DhnA family fructose-bisphosphate aldolase class Ia